MVLGAKPEEEKGVSIGAKSVKADGLAFEYTVATEGRGFGRARKLAPAFLECVGGIRHVPLYDLRNVPVLDDSVVGAEPEDVDLPQPSFGRV
jgi:hypothetical protein